MEINLSLISEDYIHLPISQKEKQFIDNNLKYKENNEKIEKIIRDEIKNNNFAFKNISK